MQILNFPYLARQILNFNVWHDNSPCWMTPVWCLELQYFGASECSFICRNYMTFFFFSTYQMDLLVQSRGQSYRVGQGERQLFL